MEKEKFNFEVKVGDAISELIKEDIKTLTSGDNGCNFEDYNDFSADSYYRADNFYQFREDYVKSLVEMCKDACSRAFQYLEMDFDRMDKTSSEQYKEKIEKCDKELKELDDKKSSNGELSKEDYDRERDISHEKYRLQEKEVLAEFRESFEDRMLELNQRDTEELVDQYTDRVLDIAKKEKSGEELQEFETWVEENEIVEELKQCLYDKAEANPYDWDFDEDITDVMTQWLNEKYDSECKEHDNDIDLE